MRDFCPRAAVTLLGLFCAAVADAQQSQPAAAVSEAAAIRKTGSDSGAVPNTVVPNVIRYSGSFRPANGLPAQVVESVTLSVYRDQTGGTPLWQETQNVAVDGEGKYSALMGSTQNDGVPMELLNTGEPRWLGVQFNRPGEPEQPRVLMASVPYALKASDAETLGGKPASAYLLAPSAGTNLASNGVASRATTTVPAASTTVATNTTTAVKPRATNGTAGFIGVFTDATDIGNSVMQQSGGFIGVGTVPGAGAGTTPSLDLRTQPFSQIGMAQTTDYLTFFASDIYGPAIYWDPGKDLRFGKGGSALYNAFGFTEQLRIQSATGNVGIGTLTPGSKLDVAGSINAAGNLTAAGTVSAGGISTTGSANVTGALSAGSLNTGNITSTGTITLANVNATGAVTAGGNITTTAGSVNAATVYSSSDISLNGNIYDGGHIIYQQPYGSTTNTALGVGANGGSDSSGTANTSSGYCAMSGNAGGCTNAPAVRPMPHALRAKGSGGNPHPDTSVAPTGSYNTAHGYQALSSLTSGYWNTALGALALSSNTTAYYNTAIGAYALSSSTGGANTATGEYALGLNTTGYENTATGASALINNTMGFENTATGMSALEQNTTGDYNTAIGLAALGFNFTGSNNIAVGYYAGANLQGAYSNNIHIGTQGGSSDSGVIRIGGNNALGDSATQTAFFASGIGHATVSGVPVLVNTSTGQLGVASSSRRFKEDIQDMGTASDGLMQLRPVTFRYKQPFDDGAKPIQYGLIAEEVAEVYPDLVAHSADGQIETVKYQVLDSMLLNEVQKQSQRAQQQDETIQHQNELIGKLEARLAALEGLLSGKVPATAGR